MPSESLQPIPRRACRKNSGLKLGWESIVNRNRGDVGRRDFLRYASAFGLLVGLDQFVPAYARVRNGLGGEFAHPSGKNVTDLRIGRQKMTFGDRQAAAVVINGSIPGPLVRMREGETVTLNVTNELDEDTSIHWHGLLVPASMDGVPRVSFPGIRPGQTFTYQYTVKQSGTYWYHSHSGLQEQLGVYGPLIVDPREPDPIEYEREYVVMLSDWTFEDPYDVLANLKKQAGYYNFQRRTLGDFFRDAFDGGLGATLGDRLRWGRMRMDPTDIADVTGYTYTYLLNGMPPAANWTGLFRPGERVRLRFINGSAASYFDVRIPGLSMTVVQADGQNVHPVTVEEFRIATAETYDVIVQPTDDRAYTIFAESMDRSGYARGTLAAQKGMTAPIPERRRRPLRSMADMGMDMSDMDMADTNETETDMPMMNMPGMQQGAHEAAPRPEGVMHSPDHHGRGNSSVAMVSRTRLDDPGSGFDDSDRKVLVYSELRSLTPWYDTREPEREIELHLTGNMERFMWSFDGKKFSQARDPIPFRYGERLRITLVNDTMMEHPIHLHGMWMQLDNGSGAYNPRKHTINVKPAERVSFLVTADAVGKWAFHCHLLYHMETGMFRVIEVARTMADRDE